MGSQVLQTTPIPLHRTSHLGHLRHQAQAASADSAAAATSFRARTSARRVEQENTTSDIYGSGISGAAPAKTKDYHYDINALPTLSLPDCVMSALATAKLCCKSPGSRLF